MTKYLYISGGLLLAFLISKKGKKKDYFLEAKKTLSKYIFDRDKLNFSMAQIRHETGNKITPLVKFNNLTGIVFVGQQYAQDSLLKQPDGRYNYAKYKSLDDWAKDYLRIVKKSLDKSNTISDFAQNLKIQKYYGDTVENYTKGLLYWYNKIK